VGNTKNEKERHKTKVLKKKKLLHKGVNNTRGAERGSKKGNICGKKNPRGGRAPSLFTREKIIPGQKRQSGGEKKVSKNRTISKFFMKKYKFGITWHRRSIQK